MNEAPGLILPQLPNNLESLFKQEEDIRVKSILHINSDNDLKHHLEMVHDSLNLIFDLTIPYEPLSDDETTIQYLGLRLFNSIVCALKLLLSGYYQNSVALQRDILETGFLLDYFTIDASKIAEWKISDDAERYRKFKPKLVREALDARDGFTGKKRGEIYKMMCEYATHPSLSGVKLVTSSGGARIGAFLDLPLLKAILEELVLRVPHSALVYLHHFKNLPTQYLKLQIDFFDKVKNWSVKYRNIDLSKIDMQTLKGWIEQIEIQTKTLQKKTL